MSVVFCRHVIINQAPGGTHHPRSYCSSSSGKFGIFVINDNLDNVSERYEYMISNKRISGCIMQTFWHKSTLNLLQHPRLDVLNDLAPSRVENASLLIMHHTVHKKFRPDILYDGIMQFGALWHISVHTRGTNGRTFPLQIWYPSHISFKIKRQPSGPRVNSTRLCWRSIN